MGEGYAAIQREDSCIQWGLGAGQMTHSAVSIQGIAFSYVMAYEPYKST
jgi:hypothetical protein